ncbi:thioredoxin 1 [Candidatus Hakubella thermalkaliphila]|uniref:Thioredoxin n=1 Tax=Candidatus Hakubella thermalkaliphila TaxID=2754717 RepID=A0A6V8P4R5_9ACTN|nr:thioredoxin [Candidatus Hakubella thermalkaliphila]GFP21719.1 thioredoxin 1 [Candidatus Hakubella thermalkaliphila]GFP27619.1 thioredoxin 1 [Candidatus Hakubella thermalkaliphila]
MGNGKPMEVNDGNFEKEVLDSSTPVLVDFWAAWCGPCRMVAPELEKLAEEESDRLKVAKLNVEDNRGIAARYGISSIPTMILFKDGKEQKRLMGARSKARILEEIIAFI